MEAMRRSHLSKVLQRGEGSGGSVLRSGQVSVDIRHPYPAGVVATPVPPAVAPYRGTGRGRRSSPARSLPLVPEDAPTPAATPRNVFAAQRTFCARRIPVAGGSRNRTVSERAPRICQRVSSARPGGGQGCDGWSTLTTASSPEDR